MNKKKEIKKEAESNIIKEPVIEYCSSSTIENTELLSDDILIHAIQYAKSARENNRMIPNDDVYEILANKLGWR